jgi:hypothetical protein
MGAGLYRLLWRRFGGIGFSFGGHDKGGASLWLVSGLIGMAVVLMVLIGVGAWLMMSMDDGENADGGLTHSAGEATTGSIAGPAGQEGAVQGTAASQAALDAATDDRPAAATERPAVDGLRIGPQSWRRGGLGSKALVTFTLRNGNPYPVKDIAIACAFSRRDGSHLTDRKRVIPGSVRPKSRKTFASVHVGFVNVNASKAKCILVAASKV